MKLPRIFMPKILLDSGFSERKDKYEEEYMSLKEHFEKMDEVMEKYGNAIKLIEEISLSLK